MKTPFTNNKTTENFADRDSELEECRKFIISAKSFKKIHSKSKSGSTFFLRKLYEDEILKREKRKFDIYFVNKSNNDDFGTLLINNILEQGQGKKFAFLQHNRVMFILRCIVLLGIPYVNLYSEIPGLGTAIYASGNTIVSKELPTLQTKSMQLYKYFVKKKKPSVILVNDAEKLSEQDWDIIRVLYPLHTQFILNYHKDSDHTASDYFFISLNNNELTANDMLFDTPDAKFLSELCALFKKDYESLQNILLPASNDIRNVMHIVCDDIVLSNDERKLLSFVYYADGTIDEERLELCYNTDYVQEPNKHKFKDVFDSLKTKKLIYCHTEKWCSDHICCHNVGEATYYRSHICEIYENSKKTDIAQLNFIARYEKQIVRQAEALNRIILHHIFNGQNISKEIANALTEILANIENSKILNMSECLLCIYYIQTFNYKSALFVLERSSTRSRLKDKIAALVYDRCRMFEKSEPLLVNLLSTSVDEDETAVLAAILCATFLHQNKNKSAVDIYFDRSDICKYSKFKDSNKRTYFLRMIAFYLPKNEELKCYDDINKLTNKNGDRFMRFTMLNNKFARCLKDRVELPSEDLNELITLSEQVPYYELRLFYNNLAVYYIEKDIKKAYKYFDLAISYSKSMSALPYIYSNINKAMATAYEGKFNDALSIFSDIKNNVLSSDLKRIKSAYYGARLLFAYMQGDDIKNWANLLTENPLSGGNKQTKEYIRKVKSYVSDKKPYDKTMFSELYLRNVTFYWYINPLDLRTSNEFLSF